MRFTKKATTCLRKPGRCNINTSESPRERQRVNGGAFGCGGRPPPPLIPDTARAGAC